VDLYGLSHGLGFIAFTTFIIAQAHRCGGELADTTTALRSPFSPCLDVQPGALSDRDSNSPSNDFSRIVSNATRKGNNYFSQNEEKPRLVRSQKFSFWEVFQRTDYLFS
jgi:hypothetical protein